LTNGLKEITLFLHNFFEQYTVGSKTEHLRHNWIVREPYPFIVGKENKKNMARARLSVFLLRLRLKIMNSFFFYFMKF